jgi:hypothetical protein
MGIHVSSDVEAFLSLHQRFDDEKRAYSDAETLLLAILLGAGILLALAACLPWYMVRVYYYINICIHTTYIYIYIIYNTLNIV